MNAAEVVTVLLTMAIYTVMFGFIAIRSFR